jgi:maleylacetoacetate isomerase
MLAPVTATLYQYWRSSCSWRVRWALAIKGVPFSSVPIDLTEEVQLAPEHRARNPIGHVPALWINGRVLAESVAIIEYLEETVPSPALYPKDPWQRARVRQLVELVNAGIQPVQNRAVLQRYSPRPEAQREWAGYFVERGLAAFEALLGMLAAEHGGSRGFCWGDALTAADVFLVPQVYNARRHGVGVERFPRVLAAERAALATEHATGALPENQPGAPRG